MTFVVNVIASLVAAILIVFFSGLVSQHARGALTAVLGRLLGIDVESVYRDKRSATTDIEEELQRAKTIALLTGRGNELQRGVFSELLGLEGGRRPESFRIILPKVHNSEGEFDWIAYRERELAQADKTFSHPNVLRRQITANIDYLHEAIRTGLVEVRLYNIPHVFRILVTDRVVFFTPYQKHRHGRDTETIKFRRRGPMYEHFSRVFEILWDAAEAPPLPTDAPDLNALPTNVAQPTRPSGATEAKE